MTILRILRLAQVRGRGALQGLVSSVPIEQTTRNGDAAPGRPVQEASPAAFVDRVFAELVVVA